MSGSRAQAREARAVEQAGQRVVVAAYSRSSWRRCRSSRACSARARRFAFRQQAALFAHVAAQFEQVLRLPREQLQAFELLRRERARDDVADAEHAERIPSGLSSGTPA